MFEEREGVCFHPNPAFVDEKQGVSFLLGVVVVVVVVVVFFFFFSIFFFSPIFVDGSGGGLGL